jgi:hypothetical protein
MDPTSLRTLLPVLMPLAPAATLSDRVGEQIATALAAHGRPDTIIQNELEHMCEWRTASTANRSVVGIMNEFTFLADTYRAGEVVAARPAARGHRRCQHWCASRSRPGGTYWPGSERAVRALANYGGPYVAECEPRSRSSGTHYHDETGP